MPTSSLSELERVCIRQDKELRDLREKFEKFLRHYNETLKDIEEKFDLRTSLTQQNAMAIQTLSTRMDVAGLPK